MFGYLHRYFFRYVASNDDRSLSGPLPRNKGCSFPMSILSSSPHSCPSYLPDPNAGNFAGNLRISLEKNQDD